MLKNELVGNMPFDINTINGDFVGSGVDQLCIINVSLGQTNEDRFLPSKLLSEENWVRLAINLLGLEDTNVTSTITEQQKDKADHLLKILQDRFQQHLLARIENKTKRTHWSMIFAYTNLAVSATCMILSNHVKDKYDAPQM
jgi:hypothetical protein